MIKKSLIKNTFYAFLLQFTNMLFPLITAPYISRVIGAEGLGKVNFATSVVAWFTLAATFGTTTYGVKEVAKIRDDKDKLTFFFSEIFVIKIITTVMTIAVYLPSIMFIDRFSKEFMLFNIQGIMLLLNIFSLEWFFQGIEDYKYITIRSILLKVISLSALFMFVKARDDYLIYAGISIFALSFSNIINFIYSKKYVKFSVKGLNIKCHFKPLIVFFLSSMVISVYALLDQVLLGFMKDDKDVALFVRTKMLLSCGMMLSVTVSNVIMPRLNNYFINNKDRYKELLRISADIMMMTSIPIMVGTMVLAKMVMILFGGKEFMPAAIALIIVAPLTVIVPIGSWSYQQRVLPQGYEKIGLYVQISMAFISIISNIILIPLLGFFGAAISYLLAETSGNIIGFTYIHKKDGFRTLNLAQIKFVIAAVGMAGCLLLIKSLLPISWLSLFMCITAGIIVYFLILLAIREKIVIMILKILAIKIGK